MKYLKKIFESDQRLGDDDLDLMEDLFLSVADKFKMVQVDYQTANHVFSDGDEIIYRINHPYSLKRVDSIEIRVAVIGFFDSVSVYSTNRRDHIPYDVASEHVDLIDDLNRLRERIEKFGYKTSKISFMYDLYTEMVDDEEITTNGFELLIKVGF